MKLRAALFLPAFFFIVGCSPSKAELKATSSSDPFTAMIATDLHYIDSSICDNGPVFQSVNQNGDGKTMLYCSEVVDSLMAEAKKKQPSALILTGDLTFNGERASHLALANKFHALEQAGVPVFVMPGNHDIDNYFARQYQGTQELVTPTISEKDFADIYAPYGYQEASSRDSYSLSYAIDVRKDVRLVFLDSNHDNSNTLTNTTIRWYQSQLSSAKASGLKVFSFTHQSLLPQSPLFQTNVVGSAAELAGICEDNGALANFSGHLHIQHIAKTAKIVDIATSSLEVLDHHYGYLSYAEDAMSYQANDLDVASYYPDTSDPNLRNFRAYSIAYFDGTRTARSAENLQAQGYSESDAEVMAESFLLLNRNYFNGVPSDLTAIPEAVALWEANTSSMANYVKSVFADCSTDYRKFSRTSSDLL